jgi:hypothetical protein
MSASSSAVVKSARRTPKNIGRRIKIKTANRSLSLDDHNKIVRDKMKARAKRIANSILAPALQDAGIDASEIVELDDIGRPIGRFDPELFIPIIRQLNKGVVRAYELVKSTGQAIAPEGFTKFVTNVSVMLFNLGGVQAIEHDIAMIQALTAHTSDETAANILRNEALAQYNAALEEKRQALQAASELHEQRRVVLGEIEQIPQLGGSKKNQRAKKGHRKTTRKH